VFCTYKNQAVSPSQACTARNFYGVQGSSGGRVTSDEGRGQHNSLKEDKILGANLNLLSGSTRLAIHSSSCRLVHHIQQCSQLEQWFASVLMSYIKKIHSEPDVGKMICFWVLKHRQTRQ
jgi:hypothetical protein